MTEWRRKYYRNIEVSKTDADKLEELAARCDADVSDVLNWILEESDEIINRIIEQEGRR